MKIWRTGIKTAYTTSHEGLLFGASSSFLKVNIKGAVLSCFKQGKEGLKIVRLYNCAKVELELRPAEIVTLGIY